MSKLKLSQFDLYGAFRLSKDETVGIEDLVQPLNSEEFLSRNADYYACSDWYKRRDYFCDICREYKYLNEMLPMSGKPAFVICEKMHELAIRVVNTIQQGLKIHLFQDGKHFDTVAQKCAQESADNLVRLINGLRAEKTSTQLSDETRLHYEALINPEIPFSDNKKQLYLCANALPDDAEHLITPGRGSSKLGTIVQAVRKHKGLKPLGFTQIHYSYYKNWQHGKVFHRPLENLPEKLLVMDDTIYEGHTLTNLKKTLTEQGHQVTSGAVTATFYQNEAQTSIFSKPDWANYIDIIPNQYARPLPDQMELCDYLDDAENDSSHHLNKLLHKARNGDSQHTADYIAMRLAEEKAHTLGADLYQVSEKISSAAVEYNQKIREQVKEYSR